ncbi:MAG: hypothetical protein AABZ32_06695, partial [Bacteroidota bacterium]
MIEIIKILIEEPERLRKFGLFIIKAVLNIIFASTIYVWIFGEYSLFNTSDFKAWSEFILSGRILICILLYVASEFLLFSLLSIISTAPLYWLASKIYSDKPDRSERDFVRWILRITNVISFDKKTNKVSAGKNTDGFFEFVSLFEEKESKKEISSLKNSLLNEILHTYFVFVVIYFFVLDITHAKAINYIIIAGCIILPGIYLEICWLIEYMNKNAKDMIYGLKGLKFEQLIYDILRDIGVYPIDVDNPKEKGYLKYIFHNNKEYILQFQYGKRPVSEFIIEIYRDKFINAGKGMILIANNELTRNAQVLANEHKKSLLVIIFRDEADLIL